MRTMCQRHQSGLKLPSLGWPLTHICLQGKGITSEDGDIVDYTHRCNQFGNDRAISDDSVHFRAPYLPLPNSRWRAPTAAAICGIIFMIVASVCRLISPVMPRFTSVLSPVPTNLLAGISPV